MMAHKQLLHELLKEDQEPFHLKSYVADRRSQLKRPSSTTALQLRKRQPVIPETPTKRGNLCKHACLFSFQNSPDPRKSPFRDFPLSPAKSPCKSPTGAVFLHIPSKTAALLVEAAMRIEKQQHSKPKAQSVRFGLFGSFLKRLKDRSRNKKRVIGSNDIKVSGKNAITLEEQAEETVRISCSCSNRRLSSSGLTDNNEDKSLGFEASTSSYGSQSSEDVNGDFDFPETRFCTSPFRFSLHKSPSSNGLRTPDFCSPEASPNRHVEKEKESYESRNPDEVREEEEEEEKEQCSPVSVLDPPFEDDDGRESGDAEGDAYDLECSYANVQRAKEHLLHRLRRFEKLAGLNPMELEKKLLEESDNDGDVGEEPSSDTFVNKVLNQPILHCHSMSMSTDTNVVVSDLTVEEKSEIICSESKEVAAGRTSHGLDLLTEVEFNSIDMMIGLDFKREHGRWTKVPEQVEQTAADIELSVFGLLVEELSVEMFYTDADLPELNHAPAECTLSVV